MFLLYNIVDNMKKNKVKKTRELKYINKPLFFMGLFYAIMGALLILDASSISSVLYYKLDTPYYFFIRQLVFIGVSLFFSIIIMKIPTETYKKVSFLLSVGFIGGLLYALTKSSINTSVSEVNLSLFGGRFQPAEFLKVFLIMYMGCYYGVWANRKKHAILSFIIPLFLCIAAFLVIFLGGDYGSAAIMAALYALVFISVPAKEKYIKWIKRLACIGIIGAVFILKYTYLIVPQEKLEQNYRLNRLVYKNPCDRYEENSGYQVCNGYIAIDNGGMKGAGIGSSIQKYMYLPASHTDFIFPIVVEELGAIFGVAIILGYIYIIFLIFKVATECYKLQNSIICYGIAIYFMLHIFVNLGGVLGLIPLTGVPLPFLSYGGSFCITLMCSFAVVQRIHIENQIEKNNVI